MTTEQFLKDAARQMLPLDGWTMFVETSGGWVWSYEQGEFFATPLAIYASPFWDNLAGIPLEFCNLNEDEEASVTAFVPLTLTGNLTQDIENYRNAIKPYLALRPKHKAFTPTLPTLS